VPSFSFYSNPQTIIEGGFKPLFADINLKDFTINKEELEYLIKKYIGKIAAIMFVSPFNFPIEIKT
jgi:dTDP-4-amino-4,6-dideoxygalactose transaminase